MATVVIIDDDYERATSVSCALNANGFKSSLVASMDAALDKMYQKWPDVVMLAETLSGWSGQSNRRYRIIYPNLYASQLSQDDARFFLRVGYLLKAKHVIAFTFSLN